MVGEMLKPWSIVMDFHGFAQWREVFDPVGAIHMDILANIEPHEGQGGQRRGHGLSPFLNLIASLTLSCRGWASILTPG